MSEIKTVTLDGSELKVEGLNGQNTEIINKSSGAVYASKSPGVVPEADGAIEIAANTRDGLHGTNGTLYLLGTGKVELRGTDYSVNFRQPSSSTGGGGDTPAAETMPYMDGIVGYFTPDTLDIPGGRWKNALNGNDIILSGGSAENECLHLTKDDFGTLTIDEPMTIYALFNSIIYSSGEYHSVVSKNMSSQKQYYDFEVVVSNVISMSCRGSLVKSNISAPAVHCVCITRDDNTAKLYIDGEYQGETRAELGDYNGEYMLNRSLRGGYICDLPGEHSYKILAFGSEEHTPEQIAQNSAWLANKIFRW